MYYFHFLFLHKVLIIWKTFMLRQFGFIELWHAPGEVPFFIGNKNLFKSLYKNRLHNRSWKEPNLAIFRMMWLSKREKICRWRFVLVTNWESCRWLKPVRPFFLPTQINKIIDSLLSDIIRGCVRYYIRFPRKAYDLYVRPSIG